MDCQAIARDELIEMYLGGQLDPAIQDQVELHIFGCEQCTRQLEILQTVQADLIDRAHVIRTQTPAQPVRFRRWVAVAAAFSLGAIVASVLLITPSSRVAHQLPVVPPAALQGAAKSSSVLHEQAPAQPDQVSHRPAAQPRRVKADASAIPTPEPPPGESPTQSGGQQVSVVPPPPANQPAPVPDDHDGNGASHPKASSAEAESPGRLTIAQGVEWYRLGVVEAPAYTFSGLAGTSKLPSSDSSGSYASPGAPGDAGRIQFQDAMRAYIEGRYKGAADGLAGAAKLEPTKPDVNFYLGVCKLLTGRPAESVAPLEAAAREGSSPFLQASHYYLAKAYIQSGKFEQAEAELKQAIAVPGQLTKDAKALLVRLQGFRKEVENQ